MALDRPRLLIISNDVVGAAMAGPGIRSFEFARVLSAHAEVTLLAPRIDGAELSGVRFLPWSREHFDLAFADAEICLSQGLGYDMKRLLLFKGRHLFDLYDPILVEEMALAAARTPADQAILMPDNVRRQVRMLCRRGDFFLCAGERQRDLWLGHLLHEGRMEAARYRQDPQLRTLIDVVPFGLSATPPKKTAPAMRGVLPGVDNRSVIALWAGGVHDWLDACSAVRALALAHQRGAERLRLVFLGSRHPHPDVPDSQERERARELAAQCGLLERAIFFLDGWTPYNRRADFLLEADLGICLHPDGLETRYAFRTRLLDHFWAGLPTLCAGGDELSELVRDRALGWVVAPGDVEAVARVLGDVALERENLAEPARHARAIAERFTWERVTEPLVRMLPACTRYPPRTRALGYRLALLPYYAAKARHFLRAGGPALIVEKIRRKRNL